MVAVGVTWKQWSRFRNPIVYTAVPESLPTELCPQKVEGAVEGQTGCRQPDPDFSDIFVPRVGVEYTLPLGDWQVVPRAGFAYEPSPVPSQTGDQNYLDNERMIFAAGVGVRYDDLTLRVVGQWHRLAERTHRKDSSRIANSETYPGFPSITHRGDVLFWGLELGLALEEDP